MAGGHDGQHPGQERTWQLRYRVGRHGPGMHNAPMDITAAVNPKISPDLAHHLLQARAWLAASGVKGENTATLAYAGFELRLAVERLAVHYWKDLLGRPIEEQDRAVLRSFKAMEQKIYDLAGHQREIDRHFEVARLLLEKLGLNPAGLPTPKLGKFASYWSECSEMCHVMFSFFSNVPEMREAALETLTTIADELTPYMLGLGWPVIKDSAFMALRDQYVNGTASLADIEQFLETTGLAARRISIEGNSEQIGTPLAPK
jgi:hypothetical protein